MNARQPSGESAQAVLSSALVRGSWRHLTAEGFAVLVGASNRGSASQLGGGLHHPLPGLPHARMEVGGAATYFGALGNTNGGQQSLFIRQHVELQHGGVYAGLSSGRADRLQLNARASSAEMGAWGWYRKLTALVVAHRGTTTDWELMEAAGYALVWPGRAYAVQDVTLSLGMHGRVVDVHSTFAIRESRGTTHGSTRAVSAGAAWHVSPRWSLAISTGIQLADLTRGLPEANLTTVSLRWRSPTSRVIGAMPLRDQVRILPLDLAPVAREAQLDKRGAVVELLLRVEAPPDATVEFAGSFNEWTATRLTFDGQRFVHRMPLPSGPQRLAIRVNGGEWRAPVGLVSVSDGLGGESGLLIVP